MLSKKMMLWVSIGFCCFCAAVLGIALGVTLKESCESKNILEDSIKAQLVSITSAADEIIDPQAFAGYQIPEDILNDAYQSTLGRLRALAGKVGAKYIYALKEIGGQATFIFDTDATIENATFQSYELSAVHEQAFTGVASVGIMNLQDEFGSFNTGAVPIKLNGKVIGIVCADIEDQFITQSIATTRNNTILLLAVLSAFLATGITLIFVLLSRIRKMQKQLEHMALYDNLTGLPNRRYLLNQLEETVHRRKQKPFALYFIDLDNFKKVNDTAGHDAGDELLRHMGNYLSSTFAYSTVFRPGSGSVNVAARVGGDEFILIVPGIDNAKDAEVFGNEIVAGYAVPEMQKYIDKYGVGLSVGAALFPEHTDSFHVLIKYADIAMYYAKRAGKNCFRVYSDEMAAKPEK